MLHGQVSTSEACSPSPSGTAMSPGCKVQGGSRGVKADACQAAQRALPPFPHLENGHASGLVALKHSSQPLGVHQGWWKNYSCDRIHTSALHPGHFHICGAALPDNLQKQWPGDLTLHYRPGRASSLLSTSLHSCHPVALLFSSPCRCQHRLSFGRASYLTAS